MDVDTAWDNFKKSNQTSVEDKLDVILAQQQELLTDTSRVADLVPMVTGDKAQEDALAETGELEGQNPDMMGDGMDGGIPEEGGTDNPFSFLEEGEEGEDAQSDEESFGDSEGFEETDEDSDVLDADYDGEADWSADEGDDVSDEDVAEDVSEDVEGTEDVSEETSEGSEEPNAESDTSEESEESEEQSEDGDEEEFIAFEDIEDDEKEAKKSAVRTRAVPRLKDRPTTKTIKSLSSKTPMSVVSSVQKPNASTTSFGRASDAEMISEMLYKSKEFDVGYGVDPHEQTKEDWAMYRLLRKANHF